MIDKDKTNVSLKIIHRLILNARQMAYEKEKHSVIANLLDDIEYLQSLLFSKNDVTDIFYKYLIGIGKEYGYVGLIEDFNKVSSVQEEIDTNKKNISKEKYTCEIYLNYLDKNSNLLLELKKIETLITKLQILGKGIEHDSTHYIQNTYFKWTNDNVKVKLYIDDYSENSLCSDISSTSQKKCNEISKKLIKLLQSESIDIRINKNWES